MENEESVKISLQLENDIDDLNSEKNEKSELGHVMSGKNDSSIQK